MTNTRRLIVGFSALGALSGAACSDSTSPNNFAVLPVELTTRSVASSAAPVVVASSDSVALMITIPSVCGYDLGGSATMTDRTLSIVVTASGPSVPPPCVPLVPFTEVRVTAREVPTGTHDLTGELRFTAAGRLTADSVVVRQSVTTQAGF